MSESSGSLERWSPVDALRIVVAGGCLVVIVLLDWLVGDELVDFVSDVLSGLHTINEDVVPVIAVIARLAAVAALLAGAVSATLRGRWRFLVTVGAGAAVGAVLMLLVDGLLDASAPAAAPVDPILGALGDTSFPSAPGLAAMTAIVAAGVPWFERRERRIGWALVLLLALVRAFVEPISLQTAAALACGALAGALADAALGTPTRRPTQQAVVDGLTRGGLHLAELRPASVDARGSTPYFGTTTDGTAVFVKVLGSDERKADLLFRLVRSAMPRDLGDERPFSSLRRAVEHEAFVALAASQRGVRTPPVAGFAAAEPGGFVLAYVAIDGRSLDGVEPEQISDDVLAGIWEQMGILRASGIAHRDLRLANVFLAADGQVWMIDFGFSELAASDLLLANDLAELVTSLSFKVGPERAVTLAADAVGWDALQAALPRFDPKFLSGATRTAVKAEPQVLADVRSRIEQGGGALKRTQALAVAGVGAATFAVSARLAVDENARTTESRIFHAVNGLPEWLYPVLWGPMQLGNLVVGAVVALAVALLGRRPKVALAVLTAVGLKLVVERVLRDVLTADLEGRRRPGTSQVDAILRGDVPVDGHSFPSGHVILVAALAAVLTPLLPKRWELLPWAAVGLVAFGRVYVGAHNPLDVTAGFGIGLAVGSALDAALGDENVHWSRHT